MPFELRSARFVAQDYLTRVIAPGDRVIDATMGNGHDTAFLAELVGESGLVCAFDVQESALKSTEALLREKGLFDRCRLFGDGHQTVLTHVTEPVQAVMFNLGWLPGGDKAVTTLWDTTKVAVEGCLSLLSPGGVMTVCVYPGHPAGDFERARLTEALTALRPQDFNVLHHRFINAGAGAPECFVIQRQY